MTYVICQTIFTTLKSVALEEVKASCVGISSRAEMMKFLVAMSKEWQKRHRLTGELKEQRYQCDVAPRLHAKPPLRQSQNRIRHCNSSIGVFQYIKQLENSIHHKRAATLY